VQQGYSFVLSERGGNAARLRSFLLVLEGAITPVVTGKICLFCYPASSYLQSPNHGVFTGIKRISLALCFLLKIYT